MTPSAIRATGVAKAFGAVQANRDASLDVAPGEIHAVVGENGAGKSTLMRMLAGMFPPDAGRVEVNGRDVTGWSTREAIEAGVGMVHQHFMLVPTLTVAENLVLGRELRRGMRIDFAAAEQAVRDLSARTGLVVEPDRLVADLSVGEAQRVEILKVLYRGARILILDEPTAVLSPPEVRELWSVLRRLAAEGGTVVLITHKLDEVIDISSTVTVMRAGETVGRVATKDATPAVLARMMVGRDVRLVSETGDGRRETGDWNGGTPRNSSSPAALREPGTGNREPVAAVPIPHDPSPITAPPQPPALRVHDLTVPSSRKPDEVDGVSFEVMPGEILGIAGVEGNGQTELVEAIAGLRRASAGSVSLGGREVTAMSVRERADAGLSHVPEDRHRRGLVLDFSVADNLTLGLQHRFSRRGSIDREAVRSNAAAQIREFDIRPPSGELPARALSGGNQQKVVIARELRGRAFSVLLASQPTRGVDVGAIEFIHTQLRAARDAGKAVLLVSADLGEVLALSDRVSVMYGGRIVVTLPRGDASTESLGWYMTGAANTGELRTGDGRRGTGVAAAPPGGAT